MLYKLLYRKGFLFQLYKRLICRFYLTGKSVSRILATFWKQTLGFVVVQTNEKFMESQKVSDTFEKITVKITFFFVNT